ncbi:low molecular weight protein-tyrosine-phosphatase [Rhizobium cremeum]|uniref:low molecular weight protein-tyrosine-phosphatase n=1 Tax=Rhizobium cremeum TaxID=2813827 RepID=UPI000DDE354C
MTAFPILFVCLGNICRSPLAEGIFRHLAGQRGLASSYPADSAGTGGWHIGQPPDHRSMKVALGHGIDISDLRARRVDPSDFKRSGLILAMDKNNLAHLRKMAPSGCQSDIALFGDYGFADGTEIPDPYYGGLADFERVYSMLLTGCSSILEKLEAARAS